MMSWASFKVKTICLNSPIWSHFPESKYEYYKLEKILIRILSIFLPKNPPTKRPTAKGFLNRLPILASKILKKFLKRFLYRKMNQNFSSDMKI